MVGAITACGGSGSDQPANVAGGTEWKQATMLGGETTNPTGSESSSGFDTPAPNLDAKALELHLQGDAEFERSFIRAPNADFPASDGVGPAFNNTSCIACHPRDGRAAYTSAAMKAPAGTWTPLGAEAGAFLRISIENSALCTPAPENRFCAPVAVPGFSTQLFHRGVLGLRDDSPFSGQADVHVTFEYETIAYDDGTEVLLRRPRFEIRNPYDSPGERQITPGVGTSRLFQADVRTSARIGLPVFGTGLLEAIPQADILAHADPGDLDGDGISGRPNWVFDPVRATQGEAGEPALGRFGWKAGNPSVHAQGSGAYRNDMGVTNYLFPEESIAGTELHARYLQRVPEDDGQAATGHEVGEEVLKSVMFYVNTLAVPARRNADLPAVRRGADLFESIGCTACHVPAFTTASHPGIWGPAGTIGVDAVAGQKIFPYTDLLLHDMGEELADGRTEFGASGSEWRTRPLWGVGLTKTVNGLAGFLHDGRARTLEEAVLWHGGEAQSSSRRFRALPVGDREALLAFLASL